MGKRDFLLVHDGILKLMPKRVRSLELVVRRSTNSLRLTTEGRRSKQGFSLLELLVVIMLFSLTSFVVSASYITFERNQRVKNAAHALKNDIRLVQNKASSGDKGSGGVCIPSSSLGGWYMELIDEASSYRIAGVCLSVSEADFNSRTINLPKDVKITNLQYGSARTEVHVLYRPLSTNVSIFGTINPPPDFYDTFPAPTPPTFKTPLSPQTLEITLSLTSEICYRVEVSQSGEVSDSPGVVNELGVCT